MVLAYAKELKRRLEETGDFQVVLTRDKDVFLPLRQRFAIAQEVQREDPPGLGQGARVVKRPTPAALLRALPEASRPLVEAVLAEAERCDLGVLLVGGPVRDCRVTASTNTVGPGQQVELALQTRHEEAARRHQEGPAQ